MTNNIIEKLPNELLSLRDRMLPLKANDKAPETFTAGWKDGIASKQFTDDQFVGNVGLRTGAYTDGYLVVVDVDIKKGLDGSKSPIYKMCCDANTLVIFTPTGGFHYYFWAPSNTEIHNKVSLDKGIDIRGENGYVVCPPSSIDGKTYGILASRDIAKLPDLLVEKLTVSAPVHKINTPMSLKQSVVEDNAKLLVKEMIAEDWTNGSRNDSMHKKGCRAKALGLSLDSGLEAMLKADMAISIFSSDFTDVEATRAFTSGYNGDRIQLGQSSVQLTKDQEKLVYAKELSDAVSADFRMCPDGIIREVDYGTMTLGAVVTEDKLHRRFQDMALSNKNWATTGVLGLALKRGVDAATNESIVNEDIISVANGDFSISKNALEPRKLPAISYSKYNYLPEYKGTPDLFMRWLADSVGSNQVNDMLDALSYSLTAKTNKRAFFVVYGPTHTGKSTMVELLMALSGAGVPISRNIFDSSRKFEVATLYAKRIAVMQEADAGAGRNYFDSSAIKNLSGSDTIQAEYKGKDAFVFKPIAKLWLATNNDPSLLFKQSDSALWDRAYTFNFVKSDRIIPEYNVSNILEKEGDKILTFLINHGVSKGFTVEKSAEMLEEQNTIRTEDNPTHEFLYDDLGMTIKGVRDVELPSRTIMDRYEAFRVTQKMPNMIPSYKKMASVAKNSYGMSIKCKVIDGIKTKCWCYKVK